MIPEDLEKPLLKYIGLACKLLLLAKKAFYENLYIASDEEDNNDEDDSDLPRPSKRQKTEWTTIMHNKILSPMHMLA